MQRIMFNKWNVEAPEEMRTKHSVQTYRTPDDILKKILENLGQDRHGPKTPSSRRSTTARGPMRAMCDPHSHGGSRSPCEPVARY